MQIIGRLEGEGLMYLRGRLNGSILDLGEARRDEYGLWQFAEPYDELPSIAIWAVASYLNRVNHN